MPSPSPSPLRSPSPTTSSIIIGGDSGCLSLRCELERSQGKRIYGRKESLARQCTCPVTTHIWTKRTTGIRLGCKGRLSLQDTQLIPSDHAQNLIHPSPGSRLDDVHVYLPPLKARNALYLVPAIQRNRARFFRDKMCDIERTHQRLW